ncbi:hypothetical protein [Corynebacterium kalidii]
MNSQQPSPAGESAIWLPTAPTTTHGTRDLIDTELVEVWDQAREAARHNRAITKGRGQYKALQHQLYRFTETKLDEIHNSIDHGPAPFAGAPTDAFGITLDDVELLTKAGRIRPETSFEALTEESSKSGLVGALVFAVGVIISLNLASGGVAVFGIFTVAAIITAVMMDRMKSEELRTLNDDGPTIELHNGDHATGLTVGHSPAIAELMTDVYAVASGWDDPIWGFYTEIAALADEAGRSLYNRGLDDAKAGVYNQSIATLVGNLRKMIDRRNTTADARLLSEREAAYRELTERPDNGEDAELLQTRLNEVIRGAEKARRDLTEKPD